MYKKKILIRFGDLMLKGKNQKVFIKAIKNLIKDKLKDLNVLIEETYNRVYLDILDTDPKLVEERLMLVSGLHSFSYVYETSLEKEDILRASIDIIDSEIGGRSKAFKIETKRANKNLGFTSLEFTQKISPFILKHFKNNLKVNVKEPIDTLYIELRKEHAYIYLKSIKGLGGFPVGTAGKGLVMMSGGIDSPVAAFLSIKQGVEVELIHFESSPMTPLESADKVIKLGEILSKYMPNNKIKLHVVHFRKMHEALLKNIPDSYNITIMRRMMYRIAEKFANINNDLVLINGESIGQVASQTLESMVVVEGVTKIPVIRPLATYDKQDIIEISKEIGTYETSILPFEDCCTVYVPKKPATRPKDYLCEKYESSFDYEKLVLEAVEDITTLELTHNGNFKISDYGFDFKDAYKEYTK